MGDGSILRNPQAFSEKIYCLKSINGKLFTSLMQRCYDKVDVRGYILEKLGEARGEEILNELYGVYDSPEDIDFDELCACGDRVLRDVQHVE